MSKPRLALFAKDDGTGRTYRHPWRKDAEGKPLTSPSVTSVLKYEDKSNLVQWAADQVAIWCMTNWAQLGTRSSEDAFKTARFRHNDVRDERAEVGSKIHETIEGLHTDSWILPKLNDEEKEILHQWELLNEEWDIEPLLTEFTVWNFTHDWAGTGDGVWRLTNRVTGETFVALIDIKSSRNLWPGHWAQIAALAHAETLLIDNDPNSVQNSKGEWPKGSWSELEAKDSPLSLVERYGIVHLRAPERDAHGNVTKNAKHDLVWMDLNDLEDRYAQFLAYRTLWGLDKSLSAREKERNAPVYGSF